MIDMIRMITDYDLLPYPLTTCLLPIALHLPSSKI